MTTAESALWWATAISAISLSAVFSGVEIGCYAVNRVRLAVRSERSPPDRSARLLRREIDRPDRLLGTLLIANNIVNYMGAVATSALLASTGYGPAVIAAINTVLLAPVLFVMGEALPKELFRLDADRLTYRFARLIAALRIVFTITGVLPLLRLVTRLVEKAAGLRQDAAEDARQRIAALLKEGASHGVLSESQLSLVDRAMLLQTVRVRDEMTPWARVRAVPLDTDFAGACRMLGEASHTIVPLVDRTGRVSGVLRQVDLHATAKAPRHLMLEPARLRPGMTVREALLKLREAQARFGVVEEESGRPVGIITARDLVEPLTGELADL